MVGIELNFGQNKCYYTKDVDTGTTTTHLVFESMSEETICTLG
jgi:hypothetical protein